MGSSVPFAHLNNLFATVEGGPPQYEGMAGNSEECTPNDFDHSSETVGKEDVGRVYEGGRRIR